MDRTRTEVIRREGRAREKVVRQLDRIVGLVPALRVRVEDADRAQRHGRNSQAVEELAESLEEIADQLQAQLS